MAHFRPLNFRRAMAPQLKTFGARKMSPCPCGPVAEASARERALASIAEVEKIMAAKRARREGLGQLSAPGS
jgi:hypothetical protein